MAEDLTPTHYGRSDIVERILAALPSDTDQAALKPQDLFAFDQLHGRELLATRDHVDRLAPRAGETILDIGSGIGGPARFIAANHDVSVQGIDLSPQFIDAARRLTAKTGQAERVSFVEASAEHMPFEDESFDGAVCLYVGMNLPDKPAVLREARRVLRPGGRLIWSEALETGHGPLPFPLPWASAPDASHTSTRPQLEAAISSAGLEILAAVDETPLILELARAAMQAGRAPDPGIRVANETVLGPDFLLHRKNYVGGLMTGALLSMVYELRRP